MKGFSVCPSGGQGSEHQRVSTAPLPSIALRAQGACYAAGAAVAASVAAWRHLFPVIAPRRRRA
jgi:hypothetical protein